MGEYDAGCFQLQKYLIGSRHGRFIHTFVLQAELKHGHKAIGSPTVSLLFYCVAKPSQVCHPQQQGTFASEIIIFAV